MTITTRASSQTIGTRLGDAQHARRGELGLLHRRQVGAVGGDEEERALGRLRQQPRPARARGPSAVSMWLKADAPFRHRIIPW